MNDTFADTRCPTCGQWTGIGYACTACAVRATAHEASQGSLRRAAEAATDNPYVLATDDGIIGVARSHRTPTCRNTLTADAPAQETVRHFCQYRNAEYDAPVDRYTQDGAGRWHLTAGDDLAGLYRGGHGDLYRVHGTRTAGTLRLTNLTAETHAFFPEATLREQIASGWLVPVVSAEDAR